jgi:hypothetical protein
MDAEAVADEPTEVERPRHQPITIWRGATITTGSGFMRIPGT